MIRVPYSQIDETGEEDLQVLPEGRHLLEIVGVKHDEEDKVLKLVCRTLKGPAGTPVGALMAERFHLTPKAVPRLGALLKRLGLVERGCKDDYDVDEMELVGMHVIAEVHTEEFQTKKGEDRKASRWGYMDFWAPDDHRAGDLARMRSVAPPSAPHTAGNGRPVAAAASTSSDEDF